MGSTRLIPVQIIFYHKLFSLYSSGMQGHSIIPWLHKSMNIRHISYNTAIFWIPLEGVSPTLLSFSRRLRSTWEFWELLHVKCFRLQYSEVIPTYGGRDRLTKGSNELNLFRHSTSIEIWLKHTHLQFLTGTCHVVVLKFKKEQL